MLKLLNRLFVELSMIGLTKTEKNITRQNMINGKKKNFIGLFN